MPELRRIRAGLYQTDVEHVGCRPLAGHRACGPIRIERTGSRWQAYCPGCLDCDPGGYRSLREAMAGTAGQWGGEVDRA